ncbi:MAG: phosphatidylserine/phosphatidylglycerophosphate/cardiolipin synthase family protein [Oligoflexia bacterium]|nr:phosphatidylserine/phosphatidylglycerophosphate/cardiolipin synthase family protein [Oligoflexia bacterium]
MKFFHQIIFATITFFILLSCSHNARTVREPTSIDLGYKPILAEDFDRRSLVTQNELNNNGLSADDLYQFVGAYNNVEYTPLVDLIRLAKKSIDIEIYEMTDHSVLKELKNAIDRGVRVRIVKDPSPVNAKCNLFSISQDTVQKKDSRSCLREKEFVAYVKNSKGGAFVPFVKSELCGKSAEEVRGVCYQHGKMVIVDERVVLLSTGNFSASNLCSGSTSKCNRDFTYVTRDSDVVSGLQHVFENDLNQKRYLLKDQLDRASGFDQKFTVSPYSLEPLIQMVREAKHSLQIQNQYMKEKNWNQAIKDAARRGVRVELMMTSACAFAPPKGKDKKNLAALYQDFENSGVSLRFFTSQMEQNGRKGYLHSKIMIVDAEKVWIGSVNGSTSATSYNREFGIFFNHPDRVKKLVSVLQQDFTHEKSENWQETLNCVKDR